MILERLQKRLFFLLAFLISAQIGYHFWPPFTYVTGVRVDYLSPTVYLLDILIVLWVLLALYRSSFKLNWEIKSPLVRSVFLLFIFDVVINIFLSKSQLAHVWGLFKLFEMGLFGFLVSIYFKKDWISWFVRSLAASSIISGTLAMWQFVVQGSIGGLWYYLGERNFTTDTIGISMVDFGREYLRAYAAFPHPNVLAFFALMTFVFVARYIKQEKEILWRIIMLLSCFFCMATLGVTFSRITIFMFVVFVGTLIFEVISRNARNFTLGFLQVILPAVMLFSGFMYPGFIFRGIDTRQELLQQSYQIFLKNPYIGIGLNNFFINQAPFIKTISPINFQPVHNIFVLALLSLGVFGWWIFPAMLIEAIRSVLRKIKKSKGISEVREFYKSTLFLLISVVVIGMFDHFFLTLEQGEIMLAVILGLAFANL
ncbi:MAG TPA: hypothetical protein VG965_03875 [Patescibacteria group bacterium]|nr:hypothetical protein [Patescibacteria group bacterium]